MTATHPCAPISSGPESGPGKAIARVPELTRSKAGAPSRATSATGRCAAWIVSLRDPIGALADYDTALKVNPRYLTALQNKANVLAEQLGRTDEAIAALDTLLGLYPGYVPARAGRGVLLARIGKREAAHADARMALEKDRTPLNTYQVAGIYALTSRQQPDDRREALRLLESALSQGFGLDLIDKDRDLDAIRDGPELRRLVEAARARRPVSSPRTAQPKADAQGWIPPANEHRRSPTVEHSLNTQAAATDRRLAE